MSQQTRQTKRPHSAIDSENDSPTRSSQRVRRPTAKIIQSTLGGFRLERPPASQGHLNNTIIRSPTRSRSPSPLRSPSSSTQPLIRAQSPSDSASQSIKRSQQKHEIYASKRLEFNVDLTMLGGDFRHRSRKKRSVFQSKISWTDLHGIELEKRGTKGDYTKH
jgi:hypothetical protein